MKITRALISVSDKSGIAKFARALERQGVDIISTGGTADLLRKEKIPGRDISSFTAFPEVLEGRVKTLDYDRTIANYLNREQITDASFSLSLPLVTKLRYGENPHQNAALYGDFDRHFEKLHGKELSFNNILDISAATSLIAEFSQPTVAILKHTNPCGVGSDVDLCKAWEKAFATDKQAPFGGIIVCNRSIDEPFAKAISEIFSEVIIAPNFETAARAVLQRKKNLRLIRFLTPAKE